MRGLAPGVPAGGGAPPCEGGQGARASCSPTFRPLQCFGPVKGSRIMFPCRHRASQRELVTGDRGALPYGLIRVQVQLCVLWKPVLEMQAGGRSGSPGRGSYGLEERTGALHCAQAALPCGLSGQTRDFTVLCHAAS